jgi:hypothetical protein
VELEEKTRTGKGKGKGGQGKFRSSEVVVGRSGRIGRFEVKEGRRRVGYDIIQVEGCDEGECAM